MSLKNLVKKYKEISNEEVEKHLKNGNIEAILNSQYKLIVSIAKNFMYEGVEFEDLFQEAVIGVIEATESYDFDKDNKFSTYLVPFVQGKLKDYIRTQLNIIERPKLESEHYTYTHLDQFHHLKSPEKPKKTDLNEHIDLSVLNEKEKAVVDYLLGKILMHDLEEKYGIKGTSYYNYKNSALKKLKETKK